MRLATQGPRDARQARQAQGVEERQAQGPRGVAAGDGRRDESRERGTMRFTQCIGHLTLTRSSVRDMQIFDPIEDHAAWSLRSEAGDARDGHPAAPGPSDLHDG